MENRHQPFFQNQTVVYIIDTWAENRPRKAGDGVDFGSLQLPHEGNNSSSCCSLSNQDSKKTIMNYQERSRIYFYS